MIQEFCSLLPGKPTLLSGACWMLLHLLPGKAHFPPAEQLHGDREKASQSHAAPSGAPRLGEAHYPALLRAEQQHPRGSETTTTDLGQPSPADPQQPGRATAWTPGFETRPCTSPSKAQRASPAPGLCAAANKRKPKLLQGFARKANISLIRPVFHS